MSRDSVTPRFHRPYDVTGSAARRAPHAPAGRKGDHTASIAAAPSRHSPNAAGAGDDDDAASKLPRSRLRRAAGALFTPVLVIVGLLGGHVAWTAFAERRLRLYVEGLQQAGEPILVRDIVPA